MPSKLDCSNSAVGFKVSALIPHEVVLTGERLGNLALGGEHQKLVSN